MQTYLDFEKPLAELEGKVRELQHLAQTNEATDIDAEVDTLRGKASKLLADTYKTLTPWQKTQVARHPERPHTSHYIDALITDFTPLAGDRSYGDDKALIGGMGRRPLPAPSRCASTSRCRSLPSSSAKAAPAARWHWPWVTG